MAAARHDRLPVAIVGAGPVGAFLACLLGRAGIPVRLFEQRLQPPEWSMAIGIMPPSLFRFETIGLAPMLTDRGCRVGTAVLHDASRALGTLPFAGLPAPYDFILTLPQRELVRRLWALLESLPDVSLELGSQVTALSSQDGACELSIAKNGSLRQAECSCAVICDGAKGAVHRQLMPDMHPVYNYPFEFVMADAPDTTDWQTDAHLFFTAEGSIESFPLPGRRRRWVAQRITHNTAHAEALETLQSRVKEVAGVTLSDDECKEVSQFRPQYWLSRSFYRRRIILAGDAAHVMSPIGGQGMNTGLADAFYLARIIPRGLEAPSAWPKLLEAYSVDRRRAFRCASRRAALGMRFGALQGHIPDRIRAAMLRFIVLKKPCSTAVARHFSMWSIPGNAYQSLRQTPLQRQESP